MAFSSFVFGCAMSKWSTILSAAVLRALAEGGAQGGRARLLRHVVGVVAGLGPEHGAAVPPQGRARLADAGAAGALLPPRLLARAADEGAVLGRVGARARARAVLLDRLVEEVLVHARAEDVGVKDDVADLLVARRCRRRSRSSRSPSPGCPRPRCRRVRDRVLLLLAGPRPCSWPWPWPRPAFFFSRPDFSPMSLSLPDDHVPAAPRRASTP